MPLDQNPMNQTAANVSITTSAHVNQLLPVQFITVHFNGGVFSSIVVTCP